MRYTDSGQSVDAGGFIVGELDGFDGNVHFVNVSGIQSRDGSDGSGFLESWSCDDGVTQPWDPETGEEVCELIGLTELHSPDASVVIGKKLVNGSVSGTFYEVVGWQCDDEMQECGPVYGDSSLTVDIHVISGSTKAATSRSTQTYRDPETGFSYRGTMSEKYTQGLITGTVGGEELVDGYGRVGSYTFTEMLKF
jgi:hypothetical protein